jgi:hypothetical protein
MPAFAPGQSAVTSTYLRYEDVAMDGRLIPIALPHAMSGLWREVLVDHAGARNALQQGILPVLTRIVMVTSGQSIRVDRPVEARSGFELAHAEDNGAVTKLFMNVWSELHGTAGKLSRGNHSGGLVLAGTLFAEHTFTRILAPPGQRAVTSLEVDGYPRVPERVHHGDPVTTAQDAPAGAGWLEELAPDTADYCFTLDQTDSNQHVNSLVYVRVFQDAVNRRLAATGRRGKLRTTAIDIAYKKPCFAGDSVRAQLRLFDGGAAGFIAGTDDGKPRCYVRVAVGE